MKYDVTTRQSHQILYEIPYGARADVGYWDLGDGEDATEFDEAGLAAACPWPPDFVISYPLDGSRLSWQHWTAEGDLHPNSADGIEFAGNTLKLVQYLSADWTGEGEAKIVRFTPGPDTPGNLVSRLLGVRGRKAPWKATLADLLGAAFKEFAGDPNDPRYSTLYARYMGVSRPAPDTSGCPGWREVDAAGGLAALGGRETLSIGVQPSCALLLPQGAGLDGDRGVRIRPRKRPRRDRRPALWKAGPAGGVGGGGDPAPRRRHRQRRPVRGAQGAARRRQVRPGLLRDPHHRPPRPGRFRLRHPALPHRRRLHRTRRLRRAAHRRPRPRGGVPGGEVPLHGDSDPARPYGGEGSDQGRGTARRPHPRASAAPARSRRSHWRRSPKPSARATAASRASTSTWGTWSRSSGCPAMRTPIRSISTSTCIPITMTW